MILTKGGVINDNIVSIFGMAAMPFLWNGTLLNQGNLPRVLPLFIMECYYIFNYKDHWDP